MAIELAHRYEQISPKAFEHPADRAATSALHSVPLLDKVIKRLTDLGYERRFRQVVLGDAVRIGSDQLPEVWNGYVQCTSVLDLGFIPDLYVTSSPEYNAMAVGAKTPMIVVNSAVLRSSTPNGIQTVLGHEVGHVLSEHTYYTTALILLKQVLEGVIPKSLLLGLPVRGMYYALLEWSRAAEMSADRAAALIMGDPLEPCRVMMYSAGGALPELNFDAFMRQAAAYESEDDLFSRHTRFWSGLNRTHPAAVRRVKEIVEWVQAGDYERIRDGNYDRRGFEPPPTAEFNDAVAHYRERFSRILDRTAGGVQVMGKQLGDWLKRQQGSGVNEDEDDED